MPGSVRKELEGGVRMPAMPSRDGLAMAKKNRDLNMHGVCSGLLLRVPSSACESPARTLHIGRSFVTQCEV